MGNFYPYEVFNVYRLVNAKGLKRNDDVEMMCVNLWDVKKEIQSKFNLGEKKRRKICWNICICKGKSEFKKQK